MRAVDGGQPDRAGGDNSQFGAGVPGARGGVKRQPRRTEQSVRAAVVDAAAIGAADGGVGAPEIEVVLASQVAIEASMMPTLTSAKARAVAQSPLSLAVATVRAMVLVANWGFSIQKLAAWVWSGVRTVLSIRPNSLTSL